MSERPPSFRPETTPPAAVRAAGRVALVASFLAVAALSWRTLASEDLGYHLAYGERLLATGQPVDHSPEIYLVPPPGTPAEVLPPPGPGCWYDAEGRYRFANANWLTQAGMAAAWKVGGAAGLCGLRAVLLLAIFALAADTMRRSGAGPLGVAAGVLLLAATSYPRFDLRPELFGALALAAQAWLLAAPGPERVPSRRAIAAVVALQLLYANLHGYFVLGWVVTGARLAGRLLRSGAAASPSGTRGADAVAARRLGLALALQVGVSFANPWGARLALLPFATVAFLLRHRFGEGEGGHPWAGQGELEAPDLFPAGAWTDPHAIAFVAFLAVATLATIALVRRRRWDPALLVVVMTVLALTARRNGMIGALVALPPATAVLAGAWRRGLHALPPARRRAAALAAGAACTLAALALAADAATDRLYRTLPARFGAGVSRSVVPLDVTAFLNGHGLRGRLWCRLASSSNVFFFTEPHPAINVLTNTWAYPPDALRVMAEITEGPDVSPFLDFLDRWKVSVLLMGQHRLLREVARDGRWDAVLVRDGLVLFARRDGPDARLAGTPAPDAGAMEEWIASIRRANRRPAADLIRDGALCVTLGWAEPALALLEEAVRVDPRRADGWFYLGLQYRIRAWGREADGDPRAADDYARAREALARSEELRPRAATEALRREVDRRLGEDGRRPR